MNNTHPIPYEILLERYTESQREIEYLEYKISALNNEIDAWQKGRCEIFSVNSDLL